MVTAVAARARLDRSLAARGEDAVLRRRVGTSNVYVELSVRALIRGYAPAELVGGITQGDSKVILSGTPLLNAGTVWPGAAGGTLIPTKTTDQVRGARGTLQTVQSVATVYQNGELVRLELQVRG